MVQAERRTQVKVWEARQAIRCVSGNVMPSHTDPEAYGGQTMSAVWADLRVGTSCGTMRPNMEQEGGIMGVFGGGDSEAVKEWNIGVQSGGRAPGGKPTAPTQAGGRWVLSRDLGSRVHGYHFSFLGIVAE